MSTDTGIMLGNYEKALKQQGKEKATIESYVRDARTFLDYTGRHKMTFNQVIPETLVHFQHHLHDAKSEKSNSIRRSVVGIRQFYRFLVDQKILQTSPFDEIPIPLRDDRLRQGISAVQFETLADILASEPPTLKALRDLALFYLLGLEGLKATELIALRWSHLMVSRETQELENSLQWGGTLHISAHSTTALSKKRSRVISLDPRTVEALFEYKCAFFKELEKSGEDTLQRPHQIQMFCAFKGREASHRLPSLTRHGLKFALYEIGDLTDLSKLNSEALRHHAVSYLLSRGKKTEEIMLHLGLKRPGNIAKHQAQTPEFPVASCPLPKTLSEDLTST